MSSTTAEYKTNPKNRMYLHSVIPANIQTERTIAQCSVFSGSEVSEVSDSALHDGKMNPLCYDRVDAVL